MFDSHFHLTDDSLPLFRKSPIGGVLNSENKEEFEKAKMLKKEFPFLQISLGVHPWHASNEALKSLEPLFSDKDVSFIGEIGLDRVWCDTPPKEQKEVFVSQLCLAEKLKKPVILHTKGMEEETASLIKNYKNKYIVHWYSCDQYLDLFSSLHCFFTVGPTVGNDPAVTILVKKTPIEKLLIETDGVDALRWAQDEFGVNFSDTNAQYCALKRSIQIIAQIKSISVAQCEKQLDYNYNTLLSQ